MEHCLLPKVDDLFTRCPLMPIDKQMKQGKVVGYGYCDIAYSGHLVLYMYIVVHLKYIMCMYDGTVK